MHLPSNCPSCGGPLGDIVMPPAGEVIKCPYCDARLGEIPKAEATQSELNYRFAQALEKSKANNNKGCAKGPIIMVVIILLMLGWVCGKVMHVSPKIPKPLPTYVDSSNMAIDSITFKDVKIVADTILENSYMVTAIVENHSSKKIKNLWVDCTMYTAQHEEQGTFTETLSNINGHDSLPCAFNYINLYLNTRLATKTFQLKSRFIHYEDGSKPGDKKPLVESPKLKTKKKKSH